MTELTLLMLLAAGVWAVKAWADHDGTPVVGPTPSVDVHARKDRVVDTTASSDDVTPHPHKSAASDSSSTPPDVPSTPGAPWSVRAPRAAVLAPLLAPSAPTTPSGWPPDVDADGLCPLFLVRLSTDGINPQELVRYVLWNGTVADVRRMGQTMAAQGHLEVSQCLARIADRRDSLWGKHD